MLGCIGGERQKKEEEEAQGGGGEGLGGSGPGRVWPVSAMPGLGEEVSEVYKQDGSGVAFV